MRLWDRLLGRAWAWVPGTGVGGKQGLVQGPTLCKFGLPISML